MSGQSSPKKYTSRETPPWKSSLASIRHLTTPGHRRQRLLPARHLTRRPPQRLPQNLPLMGEGSLGGMMPVFQTSQTTRNGSAYEETLMPSQRAMMTPSLFLMIR